MTLNRRRFLGLVTILPAAAAIGTISHAQAKPSTYAENGVAIDGTDPVAYFTERKPVAGDPAVTHDWNGVTWRFANAANRDAFAADPLAYAPQFGGYCAWAVSQGYTASTTPEAWRIVDGKLYLNYSRRVQRRWERNVQGNIAKGHANWPKVLG